MSTNRLPKLIAFDLDYTLWDLWIDTHVTPPLRKHNGKVVDKYSTEISFYSPVPQILHRLRAAGVLVAACSRTSAPKLAHQALSLIVIHPPPGRKDEEAQPAIAFFDHLEIYPGSKIPHFKSLHRKTGLPYTEMLFFDDETRNREVEALGVTFVHVPAGLAAPAAFEAGLAAWRARRAAEAVGDAGGAARDVAGQALGAVEAHT